MLRLFTLLVLALGLPAAQAAATTPADTVTNFHAVLIDNMKHAGSYGCKDRIQKLTPAVASTFDMAFLAQHVLRRQWPTLSAAQQATFITTLTDMVITTYASQFSKFNGEKFTTQDTQENGSLRAVHALLEPASGDPVHFEYILRQTPAGWRTVNVIAEGVSDLAIRSAQYNKIFSEQGFDGLITQIKEQTEKLKSNCQ